MLSVLKAYERTRELMSQTEIWKRHGWKTFFALILSQKNLFIMFSRLGQIKDLVAIHFKLLTSVTLYFKMNL